MKKQNVKKEKKYCQTTQHCNGEACKEDKVSYSYSPFVLLRTPFFGFLRLSIQRYAYGKDYQLTSCKLLSLKKKGMSQTIQFHVLVVRRIELQKSYLNRLQRKLAGITRPLKRFLIQYLPPIRHSVPFVEN